jgi:DNA-binding response OmpR family regulator
MSVKSRILVVEEEALLALDIEDIVTEAGLGDVVHVLSVSQALADFETFAGFTLAIIEARLGAAHVMQFVERLAAAGVAVVVMSADHASTRLFAAATPLGKPFGAAGLVAACRAALSRVS